MRPISPPLPTTAPPPAAPAPNARKPMTIHKPLAAAVLAAVATAVTAQTPTPPPAAAPAATSPAKKELLARLVPLYQENLERLATSMAEAPAMRLMQQVGPRLQTLPAERRDAVARDIEADVRKYVEEARPIIVGATQRVLPTVVVPLLEERMTEDELRQTLAMFEAMRTPGARKFQQMQNDVHRALGERLVADTRAQIEPKVRTMEQAVAGRLGLTATPPASAPRTTPARPASGVRR